MTTAPPSVNALLMCDQAFQQAVTCKWCVIGTFSVIWVREFPAQHSPLCVFVSLSDFAGGATVQLSIRDPGGDHVMSVRGDIPKLPATLFEFAFMFPPVTFKQPGVFTLELLATGELLTVRSFKVEVFDPQKSGFMMQMPGPGGVPPGGTPPGPAFPGAPDAPGA